MDQIYKEALRFENKLKSYVDDWSHAIAQSLRRDMQRLLDEIEMKKNPRSLEDRVRSIRRQLDSLTDDIVMDHRHCDDLKGHTDDLIQALRRL